MSNELIITGPASLESYAENLQQKLEIATILLKSGMLPMHYKTPEAVLTAILYGKEVGFSPMRALNLINVIQGKPTTSAQGLKALALQAGGEFKTIEWDDKACTLESKRGNWIEKFTYTWEDAVKAGLTGKDNWKRMPKAMLYARCVSICVNNMFADVTNGMYSTEEMQDVPEKVEVVKSPAKVQKRPKEIIDLDTGEILDKSRTNELSKKLEADELPDSFNEVLPSIEDLKKEREMEELANPIMNYGGNSYRYDFENVTTEAGNAFLKAGFEYDPDTKAWYSNDFHDQYKKFIRGPKK